MFSLLLLSFTLFYAQLGRCQTTTPTKTLTDLPFNFTLAAVNVTLPNANTTGAPLVLGQDGSTSGITFHVSSTYASYPYNDYPELGLVQGSLRAYGQGGVWMTNATAITSGGELEWITTTRYTSPGAQDYSVVAGPDTVFPILAAKGVTDLWSLCPFSGFRGQTNLIFNVSAVTSPNGYNPADCYAVTINVVAVNTALPMVAGKS